MKLILQRTSCGAECSLGELSVDGALQCYTLEDPVREVEGQPVAAWKVAGRTAIPRGTYNVVITPSARFWRDLPLLEDVPGFSGIRIHPGNTAADTEGCILVGRFQTRNRVTESRAAFNDLFARLQAALAAGDAVTMEIS